MDLIQDAGIGVERCAQPSRLCLPLHGAVGIGLQIGPERFQAIGHAFPGNVVTILYEVPAEELQLFHCRRQSFDPFQ